MVDVVQYLTAGLVDQRHGGDERNGVAGLRLQLRDGLSGPLSIVLDAPDVLWAGRTAINPVHRLAPSAEWQVHDNRPEGRGAATGEYTSATNHSTGARLEVVAADRVVLSVPLSGTWIDIAYTLPATVVDGGAPLVLTPDAAAAMRGVLAIAAGVDGPEALPALVGGSATVRVDWDPERVADHTGVTATFGAPLAPTLTTVPDAIVGRCWPAVFAAIGGAVTETGFPVVEGLLSLVHLDHAARLLKPLPQYATELIVTATSSAAEDTEVGRVGPVTVNVSDAAGTVLAGRAQV